MQHFVSMSPFVELHAIRTTTGFYRVSFGWLLIWLSLFTRSFTIVLGTFICDIHHSGCSYFSPEIMCSDLVDRFSISRWRSRLTFWSKTSRKMASCLFTSIPTPESPPWTRSPLGQWATGEEQQVSNCFASGVLVALTPGWF